MGAWGGELLAQNDNLWAVPPEHFQNLTLTYAHLVHFGPVLALLSRYCRHLTHKLSVFYTCVDLAIIALFRPHY